MSSTTISCTQGVMGRSRQAGEFRIAECARNRLMSAAVQRVGKHVNECNRLISAATTGNVVIQVPTRRVNRKSLHMVCN